MQELMVNIGIPVAQFLVVVAAILAIVFPVIYVLRNPKESMRIIMGIGIFLAIMIILWVTASSEITGRFLASQYSYVTESIMKLVSFSITAGILFTVGAFILTIAMEVMNAFK